MRKNYIVKPGTNKRVFLGLAAISILWLSACKEKKKFDAHHDPATVNVDSNLSHLLKPSNEQVVSSLPVIKAEYGSKIFTEEVQGIINYDTRNQHNISSKIGGRIERLWIKYNYQPVKKGQLIMEIYSPDLAAAQQELLFIYRSGHDPVMLEKGKQRLLLLGMTSDGIRTLLKRGTPSYRIPVYSNVSGFILEKSVAAAVASPSGSSTAAPAGGDGMGSMSGDAATAATPTSPAAPVNSPVLLREGQYVGAGSSLFTVYSSDQLVAEFSLKSALAAHLKVGSKFVFYKTSDKTGSQTARIGLIQPTFKNGENFTIARAYLNNPKIKVGQLVTARIPVQLSASWWLPEEAVVSVGNKRIVFKKEGNVFVPKGVDAGISIAGKVQIKEDISSWDVSKNAAYLVDSESFIKMTANKEL
ncbi:efflux RND transporter periplasmic adaptor subunit [Pedobacter gandavensis]|uniref:HlyD family efflux transporter periplasmic adaptor subunit n=1 Tax=Pedobacter gandavensis TaxID=2679963 RepID=A0ABR6EZE4_9SPHI|nr:efflux RND transporter periplasmic adaptor subunit [Pedobacter gandavensis]MBB2150622.1 HlyD family efflux transporter periplasmic adaptor subunit [Pedobacter gandavensis]